MRNGRENPIVLIHWQFKPVHEALGRFEKRWGYEWSLPEPMPGSFDAGSTPHAVYVAQPDSGDGFGSRCFTKPRPRSQQLCFHPAPTWIGREAIDREDIV